MKRFKLLLALAALPALAAAAPTVTFEGLVATQTCQLKINGETNPIVVLPTVAVADFNGAGSKIGRTPLSFTASDCQMVTGNVVLYAEFLGHNVTAAGNLGNSAVNGASDVAIQLTIPVLTDAPIVLDGVTKVPTPAVMISMDGANENHASPYPLDAWYVTEGGSPTAGAVTAIMEYRVSYL